MTMQLNISQNQETLSLNRLLWVVPLAMLISTIANVGLYLVAGMIYPEVIGWAGASMAQVIGANIVYLLIGTIVFAGVARWSANAVRHYWIVATIGLLLSLVMPITAGMGYGPPNVPSASIVTVVVLSLMHIITYAISVPMYVRYGLR